MVKIYPEVKKMKNIEDFKKRIKNSMRIEINHTTDGVSPDQSNHKLELFSGNYLVAVITTNACALDYDMEFQIDTVDTKVRTVIWHCWHETETYDLEVSDLSDFA